MVVYYKRFNYLFYFICKIGGRMNKRWFFFFFARQGFQSFMHTLIASPSGCCPGTARGKGSGSLAGQARTVLRRSP